ncbi:MAG: hypothetical protein LW832_07555 [Parachlamydia sp.]|jgi:hypothetical protein|nr:hypothetical protein [Parachlamydia sp.]
MIDFLIRLLPYVGPAIVFADNFYWPWQSKNWKALVAWPFLVVYTALVWVGDLILAHTAIADIFGKPQGNELTISDTLERVYPTGHPDAVRLAKAINFVSPGHIKAAIK